MANTWGRFSASFIAGTTTLTVGEMAKWGVIGVNRSIGGIERKGMTWLLPLCWTVSELMAKLILPGPAAACRRQCFPGAEGTPDETGGASAGPVRCGWCSGCAAEVLTDRH
ncbi:hypothetical protein GCM10023096_44890 [Nonomuraea ferruginea]